MIMLNGYQLFLEKRLMNGQYGCQVMMLDCLVILIAQMKQMKLNHITILMTVQPNFIKQSIKNQRHLVHIATLLKVDFQF